MVKKAKNLKLAITAGVGSDHIDLNAANEHKITVAEVTGRCGAFPEICLPDLFFLLTRFPLPAMSSQSPSTSS
jgi:phosphoglycerate dehydrogenase-like enzyme